jgi:tripartite-type tricarboxylate transporter receptor subunit TctC
MAMVSNVAKIAFTLVAAISIFTPAQANDYPAKPVSILVPFSPGGITDILGRIVAEGLGNRLKQPFIVENRPGGGTSVATLAVSHATPDGYTLLMAPNGTLSTNLTLYKSLPYNPVTDLTPIAKIGSIPFVLVTNPSLPVANLADLLKLARSEPGKLNYGSGGAGTNGAIFMSMLQSLTNIKMNHVPYRGSNPQLADTISGQVQLGFADASSVRQFVLSGKLRAIAVSTLTRFEGLPDVPTLAESGVPGFNAESWQMLVAPAKTPATTVNLLNTTANAIIASPAVNQRIKNIGVIPGGKGSVAELSAFVKHETARWGDIIRKVGLAGTL